MRYPSFALSLTALCLAPVAFASLPLDYEARAEYSWTENIGRAAGEIDFYDAAAYEAGFTAGTSRQLAPGLTGRLQLESSGTVHPEYEELNHANVGPRAILSKKFGLGPQAPVLSAETSAIGRFADITDSEGVTLRGAVTLSKRFGHYLTAQLRGEWQEHVAAGDTYSVHHRAVFAQVFADPFEWLRVGAGVGRYEGTFVAGAGAARFAGALGGKRGPRVADYFATIPTHVSNAFATGWTDYRVEGDVDQWWFELSPALSENLSFSLRYERALATNIVDMEYGQDTFRLGVIYAF
ncbi:MAG: hypothetical protein RLZZ50_1239 [Verrucomicrobiota bacterium]|jgi:hypothetical protein